MFCESLELHYVAQTLIRLILILDSLDRFWMFWAVLDMIEMSQTWQITIFGPITRLWLNHFNTVRS